MTTYTEHEQRALDQSGGRTLDRLASAPAILVGSAVPLRRRPRADFTTPPHAPQFAGWFSLMASGPAANARLRRIWAVEPRAVAPRCWRWLTTP
jgi:hypothetical protein